jgi:polyisoprenoid-binding protein YceI
MIKRCAVAVLVLVSFGLLGAVPGRADDYAMDPVHGGVTFKISHLGLAWVHGRFNDFSGSFAIDPDPDKCSFSMTIKTESIDTNNAKRDEHLRSPDFFNAKQFPVIVFKSTSVKAMQGGYEVTGDFSLHGVTKQVKLALLGGRKAEFPKGMQRTGFSTELVIKRSEFGMDKAADALGDDVHVAISFEGVKK